MKQGRLDYLKRGALSSGFLVAVFVLGWILLPSDWLGDLFGIPGEAGRWFGLTVMRILGFALAVWVIWDLKFRILGIPGAGKAALWCLPFFLVAINNAPIYALSTGAASVDAAGWELAIYLAECLFIGAFEECAVRGVVLPLFLVGSPRNKKGILFAILLSSAVFGLLHLVNLFSGAGIGPVILQVGYTFLIGAMCGLVLIRTRSIWWCVLIHFVYDIGGLMSGQILAAGSALWDVPTVIVTALLGVFAGIYGIVSYWRSDPVPAVDAMVGPPEAREKEKRPDDDAGTPQK